MMMCYSKLLFVNLLRPDKLLRSDKLLRLDSLLWLIDYSTTTFLPFTM